MIQFSGKLLGKALKGYLKI